MRNLANFLVQKHRIVFIVFLVFALGCAALMTKVNINYDMTEYLPDDSSMKMGVEIMKEEFTSDDTSSFSLMFKGISDEEKSIIYDELVAMKNVDSVDYEKNNDEYNKDDYTRYIINTAYDSDSSEAADLYYGVKDRYTDDYEIYLNGEIVDINTSPLPLWIIALAILIISIILIIMCESWVEPILFMIVIGIAVVINLGTNAFLPSVSDQTHSIAAILQLILSMDYSIILLNRYRQEKGLNSNKQEAMKNALTNSFVSITSSSITTFVGLLALVFMSFKIGMDMGIVLAKGVLISLLCVFTVLTSLVLMFDEIIDKTKKKSMSLKMDKLGEFSYKYRFVMTGVFVLLFISMTLLKGNTELTFTLEDPKKIDEIFKPDNTILLLYESADEENISEVADKISNDDNVKDVVYYGNTLGEMYTAEELTDILEDMDSGIALDVSLINLIYYDYYKEGEIGSISFSEFMQFISSDIVTNESLAGELDDEIIEQLEILKLFSNKEAILKECTSNELAQMTGIDAIMIDQIFMMSGTSKMSLNDFLDFLINHVVTDPVLSQSFDEATIENLWMMQSLVNATLEETELTASEFVEVFSGFSESLDEDTVELMYLYYYSQKEMDTEWELSIDEMFQFLTTNMVNDVRFASFFNEDTIISLNEAKEDLDEGVKQLKGQNYQRLIITTYLPEESEATTVFLDRLTSDCNRYLNGDYYLIGNSAMAYEMVQTFDGELFKITILTAVAIFIVVALSFRSFIIPLILVMLIQCGVFAIMGIVGVQGYSIYYLALLIVQSVLMGATIDYAILFTSYYKENRSKMGVKESVIAAYNNSIHTIMTSGLVVVIAAGILGVAFENPVTGQICKTLSQGALCTIMLVIFILPGMVACLDKYVYKKSEKETEKYDSELLLE